jgi:nucleoside-diphosphate-sugar epimerase
MDRFSQEALKSSGRILITGASSFSARHFGEYLLSHTEFDLFGISRSDAPQIPWKGYFTGDVTNSQFIEQAVKTIQPTHVIHLAGATNSQDTSEMFQVNLQGTWNILQACGQLRDPIKVLLVGSAASFGEMDPTESALSAVREPRPNSLYGWLKEKSIELASLLTDRTYLDIKSCRTFNLIGPGLPQKYAAAAITARILSRSRSSLAPFLLQDGDAIRDFIDVRDACRAWLAILEQGRPSIPYSVGRGIPVTVHQLCISIRDQLGESFPIELENNSCRSSRSGIRRSVADTSELVRDTNWIPKIGFEQSVHDMLLHAMQHKTDN